MAGLHDEDRHPLAEDLVEDAMVSDPEAISVAATAQRLDIGCRERILSSRTGACRMRAWTALSSRGTSRSAGLVKATVQVTPRTCRA
jgi:hypothetical protein